MAVSGGTATWEMFVSGGRRGAAGEREVKISERCRRFKSKFSA